MTSAAIIDWVFPVWVLTITRVVYAKLSGLHRAQREDSRGCGGRGEWPKCGLAQEALEADRPGSDRGQVDV